jgi:FG-GAP repeat
MWSTLICRVLLLFSLIFITINPPARCQLWEAEDTIILSTSLEDDKIGFYVGLSKSGAIGIFSGDNYFGFCENRSTGWASWKAKMEDSYRSSILKVAVSDDGYAVVGAPFQENGYAYLWKKSTYDWFVSDTFHAKVGVEANLGFSIDINGKFVVIGLPDKNDGKGSVFLMEIDGSGKWSRVKTLAPGRLEPGDNFGYSVAISKNYIIVGTPGDDTNGENAGAAYLFKREGSTASFFQKLKPDLGSETERDMHFGDHVDIAKEVAAVGARSKYVCTFGREPGTWTQTMIVCDTDLVSGCRGEETVFFSGKMAISKDWMVLSAEGNNKIYIFKHHPESVQRWQYTESHSFSSYDYSMGFDWSVAIGSDRILIGIPSYNDNASDHNYDNCGAIFVYKER